MEARKLAERLEKWFRTSARELPWRESTDPYTVWVAEVMLQQTTTTACIPYYRRFLAAFPSLRALADAPEEQILAVWEGLGYYSRARNLQKAAQVVLARFGGELPHDPAALRELPGVGEYTAGAITAIAFNQPARMVDANVRRVLGRVMGVPRDEPGAEYRISDASLALSSAGTPRIVNQALMEVGALLCTALSPRCALCPFEPNCIAAQTSTFDFYGTKPARPGVVKRLEACAVASCEGQWLLARPRDGRWRGMWEFPRTVLDSKADAPHAVTELLAQDFRASAVEPIVSGRVRYRVTKWDTLLVVVQCRLLAPPCAGEGVAWRFAARGELPAIPLPSPMRRIARTLLPLA